jgi:hypothetical protein
MALRKWRWPRPADHSQQPARQSRTRLGVDALEDRSVPAVGFLSALGVGNDTGGSQAIDVAVDAAGNSFLTGSFSGTVDFDPAHAHPGNADVLTARGPEDAFVAKYAPDNSLVWAYRMGGDALPYKGRITDVGRALAVDGSGNVYVAGKFAGSADFGPVNHTAAGEADGFVAKVSPGGAVLWASRWGAAHWDEGKGVGVDAGGNVYAVGGRTYEDASGLFTVHNNHGLDVLKFSPTGTAVWAKWINTRYIPNYANLAVNASGNVFVAGSFQGSVDFDPGSKTKYFSSGASSSGFVLNLTSAGNYAWASTYYGQSGSTSGYSVAYSLALDGSGNVIVGGHYGGLVDFKPGSGTTTLPTAGGGFVTKLNANGALVWAKALEKTSTVGSTLISVYGLAVDASGSIYATGHLYGSSGGGSVDFDPGPGMHSRTTAGGSDIFVLKLNSTGNFAWAETFGGAGSDIGWGVAVDLAGTVHLAGAYQGTVDFDPDPIDVFNLTTPGTRSNLFLVKLTQS